MLCFLGLRGIVCTRHYCRSAKAGASWLYLGISTRFWGAAVLEVRSQHGQLYFFIA